MSRFINFHPGYYVKKIIEDAGVSPLEFAVITEIDKNIVNQLINEECDVTKEIADKLSTVTWISSDLWLKLQKEQKKHHGKKRYSK